MVQFRCDFLEDFRPRAWAMIGAIIFILSVSGCASHFQEITQQEYAQTPVPVYALENVNVIPISTPGVLRNQTLIVRNGLIENMGDSGSIRIPLNAVRLPLKGRYIMPGLADMHVHITDHRDLMLMLQHGVTRVRNMSYQTPLALMLGYPHPPDLREQIKNGEVLAPHLTSCGPLLDGEPPEHELTLVVNNVNQARQAVLQTIEQGYDCVKVYNGLSPENYKTIVETANLHSIPFMGHVPDSVGVEGVMDSGMRSIEHLTGFLDLSEGDYQIHPKAWGPVIHKAIQTQTYNCPTLTLWANHPISSNYEKEIAQDPRHRYVSPITALLWRLALPTYVEEKKRDTAFFREHMLNLASRLVKKFADEGAPLLIGTDTNVMGIYPGDATLQEMELYGRAGVDNATILRIATLNAAEFLNLENSEGSVEIGKAADLVVLAENPLDKIEAIRSTQGVFVRGRWLSRERITRWIEATLD